MKKFCLILLAVFCLSSLFVPAAIAASKQTFAVTNDSAEDTVTHLMTVKFAELLKQKSGGSYKTQVYPSGQLGSDRELLQSAQAGDIAFVLQTTAPQVNFVPKLSVFDLPNLFPNIEVARRSIDKFLPTIAKEYEKNGFKILGIGDQGFRVMSSNKKIDKLGDFKGIKIRTMENKYHIAYWRALGANPTPLPWGEVYLSLQQGTIDAQENPIEVIVAAKLYEQQKYVVMTNHVLHSITITMSKKIYDKLPAEDKKLIEDAAAETVKWGRQQANSRVGDRIGTLKKNNTQILELAPSLIAEMRKASNGVYEMIRKDVGADLVKTLEDIVKAESAKK